MRFAASPYPIRSVLIANRGEIAVRIIRTCARLGIRTVAVYSDVDAKALHVRQADEAIRIGPALARASYLNMDAILAAARQAGADAVHPGYGFLSENASFVRRCGETGLRFIGPSADAVAKMGSKIEAKRIAEEAGVPIVPGYHGDGQDSEQLAAAAELIGFPVLIKASAGGGGRGMRRVDRDADFAAALKSARMEAEAAFGDDRILLEKFIANPRHLEVQLAGDRHGNLLHLFERDCSVQRNNQKIFEEAPAPNLPDKVRSELYAAALKLGRAINYDSAGTVEFIMEAGGDAPFFLEMNTRLQVEHPVTELITGIDLVEWQLLAAAGEPLPVAQHELTSYGHAVEARVTAERADRNFQPVTGRLSAVNSPRGLRFDRGVETGTEVGLYYDSLLGKLIAHGETRHRALKRLVTGLEDLTLFGIPTTQAFLHDAALHPLFVEGKATTNFIGTAFPAGWAPSTGALSRLRAIAAVLWLREDASDQAAGWTSPWMRRSATRVTASVRPAQVYLHIWDEYGESDAHVSVGHGGTTVDIDGTVMELGSLVIDGRRVIAPGLDSELSYIAERDAERIFVACQGLALAAKVALKIDVPRARTDRDHGRNVIEAPLHGVVSSINVAVGDGVEKGEPVIQMEAMKLVHTLVAPVAGTVSAIRCVPGETAPAGAVLMEITPTEAKEAV